jgi:ATP-binding cassette subfamily D (ALD) protein 3
MKGKLIVQDGAIIFDKVPIVTPNNDVLVSSPLGTDAKDSYH